MMEEKVIATAARAAHEVLRVFEREALGDNTLLPWHNAPEWQREATLAGVRALADHEAMDARACHRAWMMAKLEEGWVWSREKNPMTRTHPGLIDFDDLPNPERAKDEIFVLVARVVLTLMNSTTASTRAM